MIIRYSRVARLQTPLLHLICIKLLVSYLISLIRRKQEKTETVVRLPHLEEKSI